MKQRGFLPRSGGHSSSYWCQQDQVPRLGHKPGRNLPYSFDVQRYLFDLISARNAIVREQSRLNGAGVVDLAAAFDTEGLVDFREDFFDVLHLRPRAYPKAAAAVYSGIRHLL